ncbi:Acyl-CoA dehydrogenase family member 10 [Holothuria leucospilota]|uniref:Acyl-CoA dehydrogenase family member 10 n=1 Tax=Holothuria leucospilota TaxID=206669 RepID=A0A9Q1HF60_HOLLE|nr:Acyl-CoA dehydrogenase family member 10 [Holothuria leucospilota]
MNRLCQAKAFSPSRVWACYNSRDASRAHRPTTTLALPWLPASGGCSHYRQLHLSSSYWKTKAVIFDMGGVIVQKPFPIFDDFEKKLGVPQRTIRDVSVAKGKDSAFFKLERGELTVEEFEEEFSNECSEKVGFPVSMVGLLAYLEERLTLVPEMVDAIHCIRAEGIKTALLTNNWKKAGQNEAMLPLTKELFDVVVQSCVLGIRKPSEAIYTTCLDQLGVKAEDSIFLDDLAINIKGAEKVGMGVIQVGDPKEALNELSTRLGIPLQGFKPGTSAVRKGMEFSHGPLIDYLESIHVHSADKKLNVRQFKHGQSNPTYFVGYGDREMVLRKKPPGKLLPSAHMVEREYQVMKAVGEHGVPVPNLLALCEDNSVIGTPFYMMDYVPGRVFQDPSLPGMTKEERSAIYDATVDAICRIHSVDVKKAGLEDFGKHGNYAARQISRWSKQYEASKTEDMPAMNKLMEWLPTQVPENDETKVVHGDFRLDNMIFHPSEPKVLAVLDWELSTLGDPLADLANCLLPYFIPPNPLLKCFHNVDVVELGIPTMEEMVSAYFEKRGIPAVDNLDFYMSFTFFRMAAIAQGIYKRALQGQASSASAKMVGRLAGSLAEISWKIGSEGSKSALVTSGISQNGTFSGKRSYSTWTKSNITPRRCYSSKAAAHMVYDVKGLSERAQQLYKSVNEFMIEYIYPVERELTEHSLSRDRWTVHPLIEELKAKAKEGGLWNLFLPIDSDPQNQYGAGLTNVEYAHICELMGKSKYAPEVFNCSAPDTGNMEVLVRYGSKEQQQEWLKPLLEGKIRSCFGMTEPEVASSDATNIRSEIRQEGDQLIINGHKWWTSGAMHPHCKLCIFMGKTDTKEKIHKQQSMVLVPMNTPGVKVVRYLTVFGYDDAPEGHAEVIFDDVKVPASNILLGAGRGFEIAQGRLGPGRIHHCMRLIGLAERALDTMKHRVTERIAFGKPLAEQGTIQADIANSRLEIEQARLLTLKTAHMMDTVGNKVAAPEIAMIKIVAPNMAQNVVERAIQAHGGAGVCGDVPLAYMYAQARCLRLADGPDEVHRRSVARMEMKSLATKK